MAHIHRSHTYIVCCQHAIKHKIQHLNTVLLYHADETWVSQFNLETTASPDMNTLKHYQPSHALFEHSDKPNLVTSDNSAAK